MSGRESPAVPARAYMFIAHSGGAEDIKLAQAIAAATGDVVDSDILTIDELRTRFPFNVLFGISVLIVSEAVARDPARCAEVAALFKNAYTNSIFRHFVVANGVGVDELRARPELAHFFENVMVRDAAHVGEIEAEIRSFAHEGWPSEQHLTGFIWSAVLTFLGGLFSLLLVFLNFASRLSLFAGVVLAAIWYGGWTTDWAHPAAAFCACFAGYNLNFVQPYVLWSWLGRRWKLPIGVGPGTRRLTVVSTLVPSGGLIF